LGANNQEGLYYAALTTSQMIDAKTPIFHNNNIIDYPDFDQRFFTLNANDTHNDGQEYFMAQLGFYKFNGAVLFNNENASIPSYPTENFNIIPVSGYVSPEDSSLSYNYPLNRNAVLVDADGDLIIPPVFHNEMLDNSEYSEICCQVTVDAKPMYSGSSFFSLNTDAADIIRFSSVMGQNPVFLDNSMLIHTELGQFGGNRFYPGKLRLFNIFEPFVNNGISEFFGFLDTSMFAVNLPVNSEINIIRLATAADFLWNAASYSHDYALWKVLLTRYGEENARDLIMYADKYAVFLEAISRAEMNVQITRNLRIAQQTLVEMTSILAGIRERPGNHIRLVEELHGINSKMRIKLGSVKPPERN
jgi:hypothetical protein